MAEREKGAKSAAMGRAAMGRAAEPAFAIGAFRPEDAEGIVALFRAVYGEGYPIRLFYDPQAIVRGNRDGSTLSIVVRDPAGAVVGVNHLVRTAPFAGVYEHAAGLVLKEYRGTGVMGRAQAYLYNEYTPSQPQIEELFGEPVCNHVTLQKGVIRHGFIETGLEVALMPAEAYMTEKSARGRVATLDVFRCYVPKPHRIFVPAVYEAVLKGIYARLDDRREMVLADSGLAADGSTEATLTVFGFSRVARMAVSRAGADFVSRLSGLEAEARRQNAMVFQVWLKATEPWIGQATELLRGQGYFFGGAFPRWFDGDGLMLQKLECPPDFEEIVLLTDFSKELLAFIRRDREDVTAVQPLTV